MPKFAPESFEPTEKNVKWAIEKFRITKEEVANQTEQFIDYEFKRSYTDWQRCWRNWIRKADQLGLLHREHVPRRPEVVSEEQRQRDIASWQEDMRRLKAVK
jgi:hypothetical protein